MHLGVPGLGVGEYFADEVHGPLDLKLVSRLLPFDDQRGAYHMVAGHDVEEKGFSPFGSDEDRGCRQGRFEALQGLLGFLSPNKSVHLFEELIEWHPLFAEIGDESAQGSQTAGEPLYALDVAESSSLVLVN